MTDSSIGNESGAISVGFKFGKTGPHISRTMMLEEISRCLDLLPPDTERSAYQSAIVERNILGKATEATRKESFRRLRELYGLDPALPVFRIYRTLDRLDARSRPLLSLLIANARDPLLRATVPVIVGASETEMLGAAQFDEVLERAFPGHLKPKIRAATARHIASSWEQSGHLSGKSTKTRSRVEATSIALTYALALGSLQDIHGEDLFGTIWCQMLDLNAARARTLATRAHGEGFISLRTAGNICEISYPLFELIPGAKHEPL